MSYKWRALLAVCFGTFMATMDISIVNVALPTLSREFKQPPNVVVWATLSSSLVVTGLTLTAGRSGDLFGRKRIYVLGWVISTAGMALASFAQSLPQLIALRVLQSVGVSMAVANGNAIVTAAFPPQERGRALGTSSAVVGAGLMSGPILGGLILEWFDWRAIFYLRVPIGIISLSMALLLIRESDRHREQGQRLDVPGAITLFAALSATILAVNRGQSWGWASPVILGLLATGVAAAAIFLRIESRTRSPVVSLDLFRIRSFATSAASLVLNFAGQSAVTFLMPFYWINVRDYSTAHTGLLMAVVPSMMLVLSPLSGYVSDRFAFRFQPTLGVALVCLGLFSLGTIEPGTPVPLLILRLAIIGIGNAMFGPPNSSTIMNSVAPGQLGTASASVATSRNVGNAFGLALASTVLVGVASSAAGVRGVRADQFPPGALLDGIRAAFFLAGAVSSLAIIASGLRPSRMPPVLLTTTVNAAEPERP